MSGDAAAGPDIHKAELVTPLLLCDSTAVGSSAASDASLAPSLEGSKPTLTQALRSAAGESVPRSSAPPSPQRHDSRSRGAAFRTQCTSGC